MLDRPKMEPAVEDLGRERAATYAWIRDYAHRLRAEGESTTLSATTRAKKQAQARAVDRLAEDYRKERPLDVSQVG